jgi:hypothetical protein
MYISIYIYLSVISIYLYSIHVYIHMNICRYVCTYMYIHTYVRAYVVCIYVCTECADFSSLTPEASAYFQRICEAPWVQEWLRAAKQEEGNSELKIAHYDAVKDV